MPELSIAKCLKVKNRLAGRLAEVQADIQAYNSTLVEQAEQVDVSARLKERNEIVGALIALKIDLARANLPIQGDLIRQGELKSTIQFLAGIRTLDGKVRHDYQNTEVVYKAYLKKTYLDAQKRVLEKEIDEMQDRIDSFNHQTRIEVTQRTLDLAS